VEAGSRSWAPSAHIDGHCVYRPLCCKSGKQRIGIQDVASLRTSTICALPRDPATLEDVLTTSDYCCARPRQEQLATLYATTRGTPLPGQERRRSEASKPLPRRARTCANGRGKTMRRYAHRPVCIDRRAYWGGGEGAEADAAWEALARRVLLSIDQASSRECPSSRPRTQSQCHQTHDSSAP